MTTNVESIPPGQTIAEARAVMRRKGVHHLAVVRDGNLLGLVSAHDLARPSAARGRDRGTVADVMSRHVLTSAPGATLGRASYLMRGHSIGCLIVRQRGAIVGIVTASDLFEYLGTESRRRERANTRTAIHHRVPHRHRATGGAW